MKHQSFPLNIVKKNGGNKKSRPIIVQFFVMPTDAISLVIKKHLKGKTENLTNERMMTLNEEKEQYSFKRVWTIDWKFLKKVIVQAISLKSIMKKASDYYALFFEFRVLCLHVMHYFVYIFGLSI